MINLFRLADNDRSMQYLFQIFGSMGGVLYGKSSTGDISGASATPLGSLFNTFNSIVLAIAALIVIYVTVVGVMKTAHEGEMMGKHWSSLWIPIRMVMGIASLIPISGGYSALQIVMMWVIVQGIGAADVLWNTFLQYVQTAGSVNAKITVPAVGINSSISSLYQGLVCDATFRESRKNPDTLTNSAGYYCSTQSDATFCGKQNTFSTDPNVNTYQMGPGGACGTLTYCNQSAACNGSSATTSTNSIGCIICKKQVEALDTVINTTLMPLAAKFAQSDYEYRDFYYNNNPAGGPGWIRDYCSTQGISGAQCCVQGSPNCKTDSNPFASYLPNDSSNSQNPPNATVNNLYLKYAILPLTNNTDFVKASSDYYSAQIQASVDEFLNNISAQAASGSKLSGNLKFAQDAGWIMAGSFYYLIGRENKNNLQASIPSLSMQGASDLSQGAYKTFRTNYNAAGVLAQQAVQQSSTSSSGGGSSGGGAAAPQEIGGGTAAINDAVNSASKAFTDNLNSVANGVNPLVQMQNAGYTMLFIAQILFLVFLVVTLALGVLSGFSAFVLGTGITNPLMTGTPLLYMVLIPAFFALLGLLVVVGGLMGVYVPLIPYIIFTVGAIGWFLSVLEAMVAGPLVALGILSPSGHHEILGKAEPALMLLFNIFLRPGLMIFGLVASMLLAIVVLTMINSGFGLVITSMVYAGEATVATDAAGNPYIPGGAAAMAFNPLELAIFLCAYVTLIVTAMNKCFSAIHVIPERVIRWISGHGEGAGEAEAVGEMRRGTEAGVAGAKGAGEEFKGRGRELGGKQAEAVKEKEKAAPKIEDKK